MVLQPPGGVNRADCASSDTDCVKSIDARPRFSYHRGRKGGARMKVELKLDPECRETSVFVRTDRMTEDTERLLRKLRAWSEPMLLGFRGEAVSPLDEASISRIYAQQGRVCAATDEGEFQLRQRLYELEERLEGADFVRISNSELINLKRVRSFDLSLAGTIRVSLMDGSTAWASRRYVAKLRKTLGL